MKASSKNVGAFGENGESSHFDQIEAALLAIMNNPKLLKVT